MSLTVTPDARPYDNISTHRVVFGTITFDSAYPTGGEPLGGVRPGVRNPGTLL